MIANRRFDRLLVANRGEIAARVLKSAKASGLSTVALYSEADRGAPYLAWSDLAVAIGPSPPLQSYLSVTAIIEVARRVGASAVHPGYGFLSESAEFARACEQAGLVFVGPPAGIIEEMSRKDRARSLARQAGIAVVPGAEGATDDELVHAVLNEVGFPALVKAVAGGGGKAMHVVEDEAGLREALSRSHREAKAAFGDASLFIEHFVQHGRHIEVQVVADEAGSVLHLYERDCSIQRRHQKVIEEAPAPTISEQLRQELCESAVRLARTVGYVNLGTVEFLVEEDRAYFLEMNTRLQVEHRVTEAVTGLDLVALQLHIAQGNPIAFAQADVRPQGHAIEARIYAEDPETGFLPQSGTPSFVSLSAEALVDADLAAGRTVSTYYDPLLAKIVVAAPSRDGARARLLAALDDSVIFGLQTNLGFCRRLLASEDFADASIETATIDRSALWVRADGELAGAIAAGWLLGEATGATPLTRSDGWRLSGPQAPVRVLLEGPSGVRRLVVDQTRRVVSIDGDDHQIEVLESSPSRRRLVIDGIVGLFWYMRDQLGITVGYQGSSYRFDLPRLISGGRSAVLDDGTVRAPMPGTVLRVETKVGDVVVFGDLLAVVESMKMELPMRAPAGGTVAAVNISAGEHVELDAPLVRIEIDAPPSSEADLSRSVSS